MGEDDDATGPMAGRLRRFDLPPVWGAAGAATIWVMALSGPLLPGPDALRPVGWSLMLAGVGLIVWAARRFRARRTPIEPRRAPTALIADGPYRWTRNPIYRGLVMGLAGFALAAGELAGLAVAAVYALVLLRRFVAGEERALEAAFGAAWRDYAAAVRFRL